MASGRARDTSAKRTATTRQTRARRLTETPAAYVPGATNRREAKPQDSGARMEHVASMALTEAGLVNWRNPGNKTVHLTGVTIRPDVGAFIPEIARWATTISADTRDAAKRPVFNALGEVKGQVSSGSAKEKLTETIVRSAHLSDVRGIACFVVLTGTLLESDSMVAYLKKLGDRHCVPVLTLTEAQDREQFIAALKKACSRRARLGRQLTEHGAYRLPVKARPYEVEFASRWNQRWHFDRASRKFAW